MHFIGRDLRATSFGLLVRSCIDDCNICEHPQQKAIGFDLKRKALEIQMLKRQIELLD